MKLDSIFAAIDRVNRADPNQVWQGDTALGECELYGLRMTETLRALAPDASPALQIACRAQHIERWVLPRSDYPMDRPGYHAWRTALAEHHADRTVALLAGLGVPEDIQQDTARLLRKEQLKRNPDTQTLEDVACLVFLTHYFEAFAHKHSEDKLVSILQKTWRKMSDRGQAAALKLTLPAPLGALVTKALSS